MKKMIYILALLVFCFTCKNKQHPENISPSVLPDQIFSAESSNLTADDREKLANATGRRVKILRVSEFKALLNDPQKELQIVNFYKLDCEPCKVLNQHLQKLSVRYASINLETIFINLDTPQKIKAVNTYIRQEGLTGEVVQLQIPDRKTEELGFIWNKKLPTLLIWNQQTDTEMIYQQPLTYGELEAILQSFI